MARVLVYKSGILVHGPIHRCVNGVVLVIYMKNGTYEEYKDNEESYINFSYTLSEIQKIDISIAILNARREEIARRERRNVSFGIQNGTISLFFHH